MEVKEPFSTAFNYDIVLEWREKEFNMASNELTTANKRKENRLWSCTNLKYLQVNTAPKPFANISFSTQLVLY